MSDHTSSSSFQAIEAENVLAGSTFSGRTTISFHQSGAKRHKTDAVQHQAQPHPLPVSRFIQFPRNAGLVPRNALTAQLNQLLPGTPGYRAAALWGLGGSGSVVICSYFKLGC